MTGGVGDPMISLVVCTRNRAEQLSRCLEHIRHLVTADPWELVLVDNGSTDGTAHVVADFRASATMPTTCVHEPRRGLARARNAGVAAARGDVIAFTDDDCYPASDFLVTLADVFRRHPETGYAGGRVLLFDPADDPVTTMARTERIEIPAFQFVAAGLIHGANFAVRRGVFADIGGFDPLLGAGSALKCGEDVDILNRASAAGYRGMFHPGPTVFHHHGRRPGPAVRRLRRDYDYGRGAVYAKCVRDGALRGLRRSAAFAWRHGGRLRSETAPRVSAVREVVGALGYVLVRALSRVRPPSGPTLFGASRAPAPPDVSTPTPAVAPEPRVSVVITTYNQAPYIGAAIESVLAQTAAGPEVIVVDDGSTDGTGDVVRSFGRAVRYLRQPNAGVASSRNTGVAAARGELVAFLDGDDLWEPDKLAVQSAVADRVPESVLIAVDGVEFAEREILRTSLFGPAVTVRFAEGQAETTVRCYGELIQGNLICTMSQVMVRRAALEAVGPSDPRFAVSSDWDLYLRLARIGAFTFVNRRLTRWRYVRSSASGPLERRAFRWAADDLEILRRAQRAAPAHWRGRIAAARRDRLALIAAEAYRYGRGGDHGFARRYLAGLWRAHPFHPAAPTRLVALSAPDPIVRAVRALRPRVGPERSW